MAFLKLQTGGFLILESGGKVILSGDPIPKPSESFDGMIFVQRRMQQVRTQRAINAITLAFVNSAE